MKSIILSVVVFVSALVSAQNTSSLVIENPQKNSAETILTNDKSAQLTIGGYGEITYNQPESKNGELDIQRLVIMFGYRFSNNVHFITEIEFEHVRDVFVEQAFLQYSLNDNINIRGGLILVPMGIVNEFHEPTTYNGVERPAVESSIIPSTWREIGIGINGKNNEIGLKYQAYILNGFASVNDSKVLGGKNGLRNGRQKGVQSTINTPNFSAKVDYYGINGLRIGLAGYFGRSQPEDNVDMLVGTDVGISMIGLDTRYKHKRFAARGVYVNANLVDTETYNTRYTSDLGSQLRGWYVETSYNMVSQEKKQELWIFVRYEDYDTHASVVGTLTKNGAFDRNDITFGLSYKIAEGAVVKTDYQIKDNAVAGSDPKGQFNFGLGVWF